MWLSRAHLPIPSPFPNPFQFREFGGMDRKFYVFTNLFPVEISDDRPLRCTPKWSSTFYSAPMGPTFWSRARWAPQWQGLKMQSSMRRASTLACSSSLRIKRRQIEDMNRVHKRDGCVIRAHFTDWTNSALPPVLDWYWFYLALMPWSQLSVYSWCSINKFPFCEWFTDFEDFVKNWTKGSLTRHSTTVCLRMIYQ